MESLKRTKKMQNFINRHIQDTCGDQFQGIHIEKPEKMTHMQMELKIQADRVIFCLSKAMHVLNFMAHVPHFTKDNGNMIKTYFERPEATFILKTLQRYLSSSEIDFGENRSNSTECITFYDDLLNKINLRTNQKLMMQRTNNFPKPMDADIDSELAQAIDLIVNNNCLKREVRESENVHLDAELFEFIKCLENLKVLAKKKLYTTGDEEEARDKQLRKAFKSNIVLASALNDFKERLETQRKELGDELGKKVAIFDMYNKKIAGIKEDFQITIEKIIHESEKSMMQQSLQSEEVQTVISEEAKTLTRQYDTLLEDDLIDEKMLRAKTAKTETQLHNWLIKYDQDIGEKQVELEAVQKEYDEEKAAIDELEDLFDRQEWQYNTLMAEKDAEEERIYYELAYHLLVNRSARIIQRCWRAYKERKARRRGKKGKKGKDGKKGGKK